jgi:hypothetical protein
MRNELLSALRDVRATWPAIDLLDRAVFIRNLVFVHSVIVASENLLRVARDCSELPLQTYFAEHLKEERQHEKWLANDLASAGIDVRDCEISRDAMAMAGSQYYLIYHVDPCALLGYMAALECFPSSMEQIERLEEAHGKELCWTMRYHAAHDIEHGADVLAQIDKLSARQFELVKQNAVQTAAYIGSAISKMAGANICMA